MLVEPPLEVAPVTVNAPPATSAAAPAGSVKALPLSRTVGLPTAEAASVLLTSRSLTAKLPVMTDRFCAEALASSSTAVGSVVSLRTGASLVPVTVIVKACVSPAVPSEPLIV